MLSALSVRSQQHNNCEDAFFVHEDENIIVGVVSDGCSTGIKSHFASQLIAYCVAYCVECFKYHDITDNDTIESIMDKMQIVKTLLGITDMNMLATCSLFHFNKERKILKFRAFGDGEYIVNKFAYKIDQQNTPDYIGYHLNDTTHQLDEFFSKYPVELYEDVTSFVIASDGLSSIDRSSLILDPPQHDPLDLLLGYPITSNYLTRMWNILKRDKFILNDDLTIISYAENNS